MDEFEKKAPVIKALQWNGSAIDAERIWQALRELMVAGEIRTFGMQMLIQFNMSAKAYQSLVFDWPEGYIRNGHNAMHINDWFVIEDGQVRLMSDSQFKDTYSPVETSKEKTDED